MGRLRAKLRSYYSGQGAGDAVRIGNRHEGRVDAREQERERERLARRAEHAAGAAATEHQRRRILGVGEDALARDCGATGCQRVGALRLVRALESGPQMGGQRPPS